MLDIDAQALDGTCRRHDHVRRMRGGKGRALIQVGTTFFVALEGRDFAAQQGAQKGASHGPGRGLLLAVLGMCGQPLAFSKAEKRENQGFIQNRTVPKVDDLINHGRWHLCVGLL